MPNKVVLILVDGLSYSVAHHAMGYLNARIKAGDASLYKLECELPSMSRPLYECILTGLPPVKSGIVNNEIVRTSHFESIFSLARYANKTTAAAAHSWISELYNNTPFVASRDRVTVDPNLAIQYGLFYEAYYYPDDQLFMDADYLFRQYQPDFLFIHPMGMDDNGHKYGLDSCQYRNAARSIDRIMSSYIPSWLEHGYQILITSDHGMNNDNSHGGTLPEEREVPLFVVGSAFSHQACEIKQTDICGTVCRLLGVDSQDKTVCKPLLGEL